MRKVSPAGTITATVAPAGSGLAVDSVGNLYITDSSDLVRKVFPDGTITTVAGNGMYGYSGDGGPATSARINNPLGIAVNGSGNVYVADADNRAVRLLQPVAFSITSITNAASNLSISVSAGEIVVITGSGLGPAQLTSAHVGGDGLYDCGVAGTVVQFNGTCAPLIYTWATQVAAVVPYRFRRDGTGYSCVPGSNHGIFPSSGCSIRTCSLHAGLYRQGPGSRR